MGIQEDDAVSLVHQTFQSLPAKSKPRVCTDGGSEWVPLSGIVIAGDTDPLKCVALGTGMKCLPLSKIRLAAGNILHDWHAETLAIRAFNHVLIQECHDLAASPTHCSSILRRRDALELADPQAGDSQPFAIRPGLRILMYCSEAPCGDASMELVMEAQEDATPWPTPLVSADGPDHLFGRESFSQLGVVRRKPARGDSPLTLSKSCSDKLALKQCSSLLSAPASFLISPTNAYLDTLILPTIQYKPEACERAFGPTGRMKPVADMSWSGGFVYRPFRVQPTDSEFRFSRRAAQARSKSSKGSNISAVWTSRRQETLINGVCLGRKQLDPKGASMLSRKLMWQSVLEVMSMLALPALENVMRLPSYERLKRSDLLESRRRVKADARSMALKGWMRNESDVFEFENG